MLPIPDDASTLLCSTEIKKRRELTYYVVAGAVVVPVTLPGNGSSNAVAAASLDHMYVFAAGEFGGLLRAR